MKGNRKRLEYWRDGVMVYKNPILLIIVGSFD
jgi:hypothetical protein